MNSILFTLLLQTTGGDPNWSALWAWLTAGNYYRMVVIILGAVFVFSVALWLLRHVISIGVVATVLALVVTALLTTGVLWYLKTYLIPQSVAFGPDAHNIIMNEVGNAPPLIVPGEPIPSQQPPQGTQPPSTTQPPTGFVKGRYEIQIPPPDNSCTLRAQPDRNSAFLGEIPNGTVVNVIEDWVPSNPYGGCAYRGHIAAVSGYPSGWIHCACVQGHYLGP